MNVKYIAVSLLILFGVPLFPQVNAESASHQEAPIEINLSKPVPPNELAVISIALEQEKPLKAELRGSEQVLIIGGGLNQSERPLLRVLTGLVRSHTDNNELAAAVEKYVQNLDSQGKDLGRGGRMLILQMRANLLDVPPRLLISSPDLEQFAAVNSITSLRSEERHKIFRYQKQTPELLIDGKYYPWTEAKKMFEFSTDSSGKLEGFEITDNGLVNVALEKNKVQHRLTLQDILKEVSEWARMFRESEYTITQDSLSAITKRLAIIKSDFLNVRQDSIEFGAKKNLVTEIQKLLDDMQNAIDLESSKLKINNMNKTINQQTASTDEEQNHLNDLAAIVEDLNLTLPAVQNDLTAMDKLSGDLRLAQNTLNDIKKQLVDPQNNKDLIDSIQGSIDQLSNEITTLKTQSEPAKQQESFGATYRTEDPCKGLDWGGWMSCKVQYVQQLLGMLPTSTPATTPPSQPGTVTTPTSNNPSITQTTTSTTPVTAPTPSLNPTPVPTPVPVPPQTSTPTPVTIPIPPNPPTPVTATPPPSPTTTSGPTTVPIPTSPLVANCDELQEFLLPTDQWPVLDESNSNQDFNIFYKFINKTFDIYQGELYTLLPRLTNNFMNKRYSDRIDIAVGNYSSCKIGQDYRKQLLAAKVLWDKLGTIDPNRTANVDPATPTTTPQGPVYQNPQPPTQLDPCLKLSGWELFSCRLNQFWPRAD